MKGCFTNYTRSYHRNGWNRILVEIGIKSGSIYYAPFYDGIRYHSECWHEHYVTIMISIIASIIKNISTTNI